MVTGNGRFVLYSRYFVKTGFTTILVAKHMRMVKCPHNASKSSAKKKSPIDKLSDSFNAPGSCFLQVRGARFLRLFCSGHSVVRNVGRRPCCNETIGEWVRRLGCSYNTNTWFSASKRERAAEPSGASSAGAAEESSFPSERRERKGRGGGDRRQGAVEEPERGRLNVGVGGPRKGDAHCFHWQGKAPASQTSRRLTALVRARRTPLRSHNFSELPNSIPPPPPRRTIPCAVPNSCFFVFSKTPSSSRHRGATSHNNFAQYCAGRARRRSELAKAARVL